MAVPRARLRDVRFSVVRPRLVGVLVGVVGYVSAHLLPSGMLPVRDLEATLMDWEAALGELRRAGAVELVVGMDANTAFTAQVPDLVGPWRTAALRGARAEEGRRTRLLEWMATAGLRAANTWEPEGGDDGEAWTWRRNAASAANTARAQIDFVMVTEGLAGEARTWAPHCWVSDHRAVTFLGERFRAPPPRPPPPGEPRRMTGWQPADDAAAEAYRAVVARRLSCAGADVDDLTGGIVAAAKAVRHTTAAGRRLAADGPCASERAWRKAWRGAASEATRAAARREFKRLRRARRGRARTAAALVDAGRRDSGAPVGAMRREDGTLTRDVAEWDTLRANYLAGLWRGVGVDWDLADEIEEEGAVAQLLAEHRAESELRGWRLKPLTDLEWARGLGRSRAAGTVDAQGLCLQMVRSAPWLVRARVRAALDEAMAQGMCSPLGWRTFLVVPIPKERVPNPGPADQRYLGINACLQKVLATALLTRVPAAPSWLVGYSAGRCVADLAGALREAVWQAALWTQEARPCVLISADLRRAFDSVGRRPLATALVAEGWPPECAELLLAPLFGATARVGNAGTLLPTKGLRTGSGEAPALLNALLAWLLRPVVEGWRRRGVGWGGASCPSLLVWADNVWLLARSEHEGRQMWQDVCAEIVGRGGLRWKPSSLELLAAGAAPGLRNSRAHWEAAGGEYTFRRVSDLPVLGTRLDFKADSLVEVRGALCLGEAAWRKHRQLWADRAVPLGAKLRVWQRDVTSVLRLHCSGWHISRALLEELRRWERRKLLRLTGRRARRDGEDAAGFWRRAAEQTRSELDKVGVLRLEALVLRAVHARAGALAKAPPDDAAAAVSWRSLSWRRACDWAVEAARGAAEDPSNGRAWQHRRPGRPPPRWEEPLVSFAGPDWRGLAAEPDWEEGASDFVIHVLALFGLSRGGGSGGSGGSCDAAAGAARTAARLQPPPVAAVAPEAAMLWPRSRAPCAELLVDARAIADSHRGCAAPPRRPLAAAMWQVAAAALHQVAGEGWAWRCAEPLAWVPRRLNAAADALAAAGAAGPVRHSLTPQAADGLAAVLLAAGARVRCWSDGALREGLASYGALSAVWAEGRWWLAEAVAGQLPRAATVPDAEHAGAAWSAVLLTRLARAAAGRRLAPLGGLDEGLGQVAHAQLQLELRCAWPS